MVGAADRRLAQSQGRDRYKYKHCRCRERSAMPVVPTARRNNAFTPPLLSTAVAALVFLVLATAVRVKANNLLGGKAQQMQQQRQLEQDAITVNTLPLPIATNTVPLHSNDGTHHAYLYVGSPPQRRTLIVDTGSRLIAFPCQPCHNCGRHVSDNYFDPGQSTTDITLRCGECQFDRLSSCGHNNTCQFVQRYTEGSTLSAYEISDLMFLGTNDPLESSELHMRLSVPFVFGCQTSVSGLFLNQYADGIMGIAMHQVSLVTALYDAGAIQRNAFSLCLDGDGGVFSLGGTGLMTYPTAETVEATSEQSARHLEPMRYTPLVKDHGWYAVGITSVHLGDILLTTESNPSILASFNDDKGTIIDSGTTDSYLPRVASKPFRMAWEKITGRIYSNKLERYTYEEFTSLPSITITLLGDVKWEIRAESYMEATRFKRKTKARGGNTSKEEIIPFDVHVPWKGIKTFTNRVYLDEPRGCVLGGNAMSDHDILFDVAARRVGIARADCTYRSSDNDEFVVV